MTNGISAAIDAINAAGGVKGRPLELVACDNQSNPNKAAECARQLAADDTVIATVGVHSLFGGDTDPILEQASLAGIGTNPEGSGDFNSSVVFPTNIGSQIFLGAAALAHDTLHAKSIGLAYLDTPAAAQLVGLIDKFVLGPRGSKLSGTVAIPQTAADVTPQAAALSKADAQGVAVLAQTSIRYIRAARQQGYTGPLIVSTSQLTAAQVSANLAGFSNNLYGVGWYNTASSGWATMLAEAKKYTPHADISDIFANAWLATHMFADVAAKLPEISRKSVLDAMGSLAGYDTGGMTLPLDYTAKSTALGGGASRLVPSVVVTYAAMFKDGHWTPVSGGPIDVYAAPKS